MSRLSPETLPRQYHRNNRNTLNHTHSRSRSPNILIQDPTDDSMEKELASLQEELLEKIDILRIMERKNETLDRERKTLKVNLREVELKIGRILKRRDELNEGLENLNLHEIQAMKQEEIKLSQLQSDKVSLQAQYDHQLAQYNVVKQKIDELRQKNESK